MIATQFAEMLNELLEEDREAVTALIEQRVDCNDGFADHPHVTVLKAGTTCQVGMLGLINGLIRKVDGPSATLVVACYDMGDLNHITKFDTIQPKETWVPGVKPIQDDEPPASD
ncbi:MAG: hypothetical protein KDB07_11410 [Planctomycetes bacterium]|nr:hypothetical protein [Planctomycetota bacterium]